MLKNGWGDLGINAQIGIIILSFMSFYIISIIFISMYSLNHLYMPDINWHVYDEVGVHFLNKVSNMSQTTALRINGFDKLQKDNAAKLGKFIEPLLNVTDGNYNEVFPLKWRKDISGYKYCTSGVSESSRQIMFNTDDLWQMSASAKYGSKNDYEVDSIIVVFENQGLCSYSSNSTVS